MSLIAILNTETVTCFKATQDSGRGGRALVGRRDASHFLILSLDHQKASNTFINQHNSIIITMDENTLFAIRNLFYSGMTPPILIFLPLTTSHAFPFHFFITP